MKTAKKILKAKCKEFNINIDKTFVRFEQALIEAMEEYASQEPVVKMSSEEKEQLIKDKIEIIIDNAIHFDLETYERDCIDQIYDLFLSQIKVVTK